MAIDLSLAGSTKAHGGCGCGCSSEETPELLAQSLPKVIRHGAIIGGLTSLKPGRQMVIVFSHDPLPLLTQLNRAAPDAVELEYLERGPEAWKLQFTRR